jgi:outer membrane protein TolC
MRALGFAIVLVFLAGFADRALSQENIFETEGTKEVTELSVDEYTRLALQESLNARISRHGLGSNTFGYRATYLSSRYPTLTATGAASRAETKGNPSGIDSQTNTYDTSLTYAQPLYATGGSLQTVLGQSETKNVSEGSSPFLSGRKPQLNLTYTQPLFLFVHDPNKRAWRRAELNYENQLDNYETDRLNVVFDARNLYDQVLLNLSQLGVQKKKLRSSEEVKMITQAMVNAGRVAPIELNRAEIRFHDDERSLQNARVAYWQILNQAKDRVGVARDTVVVFTSTLTYTPFDASLEKLIEYAYIHQPGIRSARRNMELSEISLREAQEGIRPHFTLTGTGGLVDATGTPALQQTTTILGLPTTTGGTIADYEKSWSAQIGFSWPFFDSHKTYYTVLSVRESLEIARLQLQAQERNTQVQVSNAYVDIKRTEEQILGYDVNRIQSMENVRIVKARYRQGLDRLIDVFDAEDQSRAIDLEFLNLLFTYTRSVDAVSQLIGGDARKVK